MSIETGVVLNLHGEPIYWHVPAERSFAFLPDSRDLWDVLWSRRDEVGGFAHTHPGEGMPAPSSTDVTTFGAIESGLGKCLDWWILSSDCYVHYLKGGTPTGGAIYCEGSASLVDKYALVELGFYRLPRHGFAFIGINEKPWMKRLHQLSYA